MINSFKVTEITSKGRLAMRELYKVKLNQQVVGDAPLVIIFFLTPRIKKYVKEDEIRFIISSALKPYGANLDVDYKIEVQEG